MTQQRALELLNTPDKLARWEIGEAPVFDRGGYISSQKQADGSYLCEQAGGLTRREDAEVKTVWETMPGYTCWHDALVRIAKGEA